MPDLAVVVGADGVVPLADVNPAIHGDPLQGGIDGLHCGFDLGALHCCEQRLVDLQVLTARIL